MNEEANDGCLVNVPPASYKSSPVESAGDATVEVNFISEMLWKSNALSSNQESRILGPFSRGWKTRFSVFT